MGRPQAKKGNVAKNKRYSKTHRTRRRTKDLDQRQDLIQLEQQGKLKPQPIDPDLPGLGQFPCLPCDRFFASQLILEAHKRSKDHKKMVKRTLEPQYSQREADAAAGMADPVNTQPL